MTGTMYFNAMRLGFDGDPEAIAGRRCGEHRNRRFRIASEHGLQQVGLLGLGRQAGGRAAALDVANHQRQFDGMTARPIASVFSAMPGPEVVVIASAPA